MGPETLSLVRHFLCPRLEGLQKDEGLRRWRIQERKHIQATWVEQWVWVLQDYRQLLRDAGVVPTLLFCTTWTLTRTMN